MIRSRHCLRKMVTAESRQWLGLRAHYLKGLLPISGGIMEQPNAFEEAMQVIEVWVSKDDK